MANECMTNTGIQVCVLKLNSALTWCLVFYSRVFIRKFQPWEHLNSFTFITVGWGKLVIVIVAIQISLKDTYHINTTLWQAKNSKYQRTVWGIQISTLRNSNEIWFTLLLWLIKRSLWVFLSSALQYISSYSGYAVVSRLTRSFCPEGGDDDVRCLSAAGAFSCWHLNIFPLLIISSKPPPSSP